MSVSHWIRGLSIGMKLRHGNLKKDIEIEAGSFDWVEVNCREGSILSVLAEGAEGDDFSVYLVGSSDVKKTPLVGTVTEFDPSKALWKKEKVRKVKKEYETENRDVLYLFFDNIHAKSRSKLISVDISVEHPPLFVEDEPLQESFEVEAGDYETVDISPNAGDTIRVFGRVTKGNDLSVYVLSQLYETPDHLHLDKAYWKKEKAGDIDISYQCSKTEPLLLVFDNGYSRMTSKMVDVSIDIVRGEGGKPTRFIVCPFCQQKNPKGSTVCEHCKGKL